MTSRIGGLRFVTIQFDLSRDINGAAREVQAAINSAAGSSRRTCPRSKYRKINPAEQSSLIMTLESDVVPRPQLYDIASSIFAQKRRGEGGGSGDRRRKFLARRSRRSQPATLSKYNVGIDQSARFCKRERQPAKGSFANAEMQLRFIPPISSFSQKSIRISSSSIGTARRPAFGPGPRRRWERRHPQLRVGQRQADGADQRQSSTGRQRRRNRARVKALMPGFQASFPFRPVQDRQRPDDYHGRILTRRARNMIISIDS